jgi:hypothetical protein
MITNCMNRDLSAGGNNTFNSRDGATWDRVVGNQDATDVRNIFTTYPEPQNGSLDINDPWISTFGGHERAVHCHNNMEQGSSGSTGTFWQSIE